MLGIFLGIFGIFCIVGILYKSVDKWRQHRVLREDEEQSEEDDHDEDRQQPPLLADAHEGPEVGEDGEFGHGWSLPEEPEETEETDETEEHFSSDSSDSSDSSVSFVTIPAMQLPQFQIHAAIEEKHWWFLGRRALFRALLHHVVPPHTGAKLLDVGCGTGGNTAAFAGEYDCLGVDPVPEAVAYAQERFPACHFRVGHVPQDVPDETRDADIILLADVLEHVEDDRRLVADILAAMKSGAHLLMMAPADPRLWSPHDRGFEHFRRYDLARARELWQGQPAEELVCTYVNARLYWPVRLVRIFTRLLNRSLGPSDTDLSLPPAPVNALLRRIFASEERVLIDLLNGKRQCGFRHGVSFLALLRRI